MVAPTQACRSSGRLPPAKASPKLRLTYAAHSTETEPQRPLRRKARSDPVQSRRYALQLAASACGDVAAESQRVGNLADRLEATPGAAHDDRSETEEASGDCLLDIDALDLAAVHLQGVAG